jgi:hypothetical protein
MAVPLVPHWDKPVKEVLKLMRSEKDKGYRCPCNKVCTHFHGILQHLDSFSHKLHPGVANRTRLRREFESLYKIRDQWEKRKGQGVGAASPWTDGPAEKVPDKMLGSQDYWGYGWEDEEAGDGAKEVEEGSYWAEAEVEVVKVAKPPAGPPPEDEKWTAEPEEETWTAEPEESVISRRLSALVPGGGQTALVQNLSSDGPLAELYKLNPEAAVAGAISTGIAIGMQNTFMAMMGKGKSDPSHILRLLPVGSSIVSSSSQGPRVQEVFGEAAGVTMGAKGSGRKGKWGAQLALVGSEAWPYPANNYRHKIYRDDGSEIKNPAAFFASGEVTETFYNKYGTVIKNPMAYAKLGTSKGKGKGRISGQPATGGKGW